MDCPRVVFVDDDPECAASAASFVDREASVNVRTVAADGPAEALDRVAEERVDCVVSDYAMAGTDGLALLDAVRRHSPGTAFVLFTEDGSEALAGEAVAAGVNQYLPKEEGFETLVDRVERALGPRRADAAEESDEGAILASLLAQVPVGIYIKNRAGEHVRVSDHHLERLTKAWGTTPAGEPFTRETVLGRTDEELFPGEVGEKTYGDDRRVIDGGETVSRTEHHERHEGDEVWVRTTKAPWRDEEGTVRGLIGVSIDVTERRRYERELERQNDRLDRFAELVSHDLRNPLNVAEGWLDLARERDDEEPLDRIETAHDRMREIIEDVLAVARGAEVEATAAVDIGEVAEGCWETIDGDGELVAEDPPVVTADGKQLRRLLENLFRNSTEHGAAEGSVTVRVGALDGEQGFYVEDDGPGIPESERADVFDPGYSTGDGSGLGLDIVERIAAAHGWSVAVTDGEDGGARFEFRTAQGGETSSGENS